MALTERYLPASASTTIEPVMCGCKAQKYAKLPGVVNVNENLSSVSSALDLNDRVFDIDSMRNVVADWSRLRYRRPSP